jgi:STI1 domain
MFDDPNLLGKIAGSPSTKHLIADPSFMQKLQLVQKNPQLLQQTIMQDQRFMQVMAMLLGINMSTAPSTGEPMQTDEYVSSLPHAAEKTKLIQSRTLHHPLPSPPSRRSTLDQKNLGMSPNPNPLSRRSPKRRNMLRLRKLKEILHTAHETFPRP